MYFFSFFLCLSGFVSLSVFLFLVAIFDGLRPVLVANNCTFRSLANKLRSFVLLTYRPIIALRDVSKNWNCVVFFELNYSMSCFMVG